MSVNNNNLDTTQVLVAHEPVPDEVWAEDPNPAAAVKCRLEPDPEITLIMKQTCSNIAPSCVLH